MRTDLYRDPKVIAMAAVLERPDGDLAQFVSQNCQRDMTVTRNVTRNVTVGALVSVWGVLRHRGDARDRDLVVRDGDLATIDDIADLPGFGGAMASVGWVEETPDGLVFPGFFNSHNSDPTDKQRAQNADRQRRHREKKRNVTDNVTVTHRGEESREEIVIERERERDRKEKKDLDFKNWISTMPRSIFDARSQEPKIFRVLAEYLAQVEPELDAAGLDGRTIVAGILSLRDAQERGSVRKPRSYFAKCLENPDPAWLDEAEDWISKHKPRRAT